MYVKEGNNFYEITEHTNSVVKKMVPETIIVIPDNLKVKVNESVFIPIIYKTLNLESGNYNKDLNINKDILVGMNGEPAGTIPIVAGEGVLEFNSSELGIFLFDIDSKLCEVTVHA